MKRILAFILAALMILSTVGCGGQQNNGGNEIEEIKIVGWLIDVGAPQDTLDIDEGQLYLDQDTYNLYQLINSEWVLVDCIRGNGEAPSIEQKNGVWYINGRNTRIFSGNSTEMAEISVIGGYLHINGVDTGIPAKENKPIVLEKLTEEEFRNQPAMFGSPWVSNSTRMKILVKIRMARGTKITFLGDTSVYCWGVMETTDKDNASDGAWKDSGWNTSWADPAQATYTTTYASGYLVITVGKFNSSGKVGATLTEEELNNIHSMFKIEGNKANVSSEGAVNNVWLKETMVSINHRGWYEAPENTLAAYRESHKHGFKYVECDVQFTKDGVPVLLHDDSIDRTSDGSGDISQLTYEQVLQYDFSYDDKDTVTDFSAYRGEKIPKFEDFIALCKELGLHPYIEIKGSITNDQAKKLVQMVVKADMLGKVSWLSFSGDALARIAEYDVGARLVWVLTDTNADKIAKNNVPFAEANLMTGDSEVVFDLYYTLANQAVADLLKNHNIPLEVWTVNNINDILNLNPYVTGVTSDKYNAKQVFADNGINK